VIGPSPLAGGALERRLRREVQGEVRLDPLGRGLYATDASIYQVFPLGVVLPRDAADVQAVLALCREAGIPVLPRGGGTSQCGQTVGEAVVLDCSRHLRIVDVDVPGRRGSSGTRARRAQPRARPHGLFFPVIPDREPGRPRGMAANNSPARG
jgi:FAD/FMN-containing dehydrogenase